MTLLKTNLPVKLTAVKSGRFQSADFIIADAKDADMALGIQAPAPNPGGVWFALPRIAIQTICSGRHRFSVALL